MRLRSNYPYFGGRTQKAVGDCVYRQGSAGSRVSSSVRVPGFWGLYGFESFLCLGLRGFGGARFRALGLFRVSGFLDVQDLMGTLKP